MGEILGVLAAVLSSGLGGTAVGATRYVVGAADPLAIGALRFGIGFVLLLPLAFGRRSRWPPRRDWAAVTALGLLFFGLFPILFNASLLFTTAARAALALSTLPLLTMIVAAVLKVEPLTRRKSSGVVIAMAGVSIALLTDLTSAPDGAWRGDLLMVCAAFCMALYNVWSRPFIQRSGPLSFTAMAMGIGAFGLAITSGVRGSFAALAQFQHTQWLAVIYLGIFGAAINFFLWSYALERTTPTRVAISVTVNPVSASLVGATLLHEPIQWNIVLGLATVLTGILLACTPGRHVDRPLRASD